MNPRLLNWICCPMCGGPLRLQPFVGGREIEEGRLGCEGCGRGYPIIGGIPRLLPEALWGVVRSYHRDFFDRYGKEFEGYGEEGDGWKAQGDWGAKRRTAGSFSYQWRKFKAMLPHWEQIFLDSIRPIDRNFFRGKVGLDAGCGFGRSLVYATSYGAEVIGMDLSEAIEAAYENTRQLSNVHLVQGDIFYPPFRDRSMEFVYSIGVLHHLPDSRGGFSRLTRLLVPGAPIFIWLYARGRGRQIALLRLVRAVTTRLPYPVLDILCLGLAVVQSVSVIWPYRVLNRFVLTRPIAQWIPFTFHARYPFQVLYTDWFDTLSVPLMEFYRSEEVEIWFKGLERVTMASDWGREGGGGRALGYAA